MVDEELLKDINFKMLDQMGFIHGIACFMKIGFYLPIFQRMDVYIIVQPEIIHRSLKFKDS